MSGFGFTGFKLGSKSGGLGSKSGGANADRSTLQSAFPLPSNIKVSGQYGSSMPPPKRRNLTEDEYFGTAAEDEHDDADEANKQTKSDYQPAPGSPTNQKDNENDDDDEDDPLDSFMADIEVN